MITLQCYAAAPRMLLAALLSTTAAVAQSDIPLNSIQLGYARASFNVNSGTMKGPPDSTPAGAKANTRDKNVLAFVYERRITGPWSITIQGGLPPIIGLQAAGTAHALGDIGTVRAWFPTIMGTYNWEVNSRLTLHAGAGLNYAFFTDGKINSTYNTAFDGTSSRARFSPSLGPTIKLGASWSLTRNWFVDLSYNRYWIRTTAKITTSMPDADDIQRKVRVRVDPDIYAFTVGYRF